jgi:DNA polymerase (family 10)
VDNAAVAAVFAEMGELLSIVGGDPYRARAFRQTARIVEQLRSPLAELLREGRLRGIEGLGAGSIERIADILRTGTCVEHQRLVQRVPRELRALLSVRGLGPRQVRLIHDQLGISTLAQLEVAARSGRLGQVAGLGASSVDAVLRELEARRDGPPRRLLLSEALELGAVFVAWMLEDPHTLRVEQAGSARRRGETVGDLDLVVASTAPTLSSARFVAFPEVRHILRQGEGRASVVVGAAGVQVDLRLTSLKHWGAALHAMTGSQAHNIALRVRANRQRVVVSELGVWERRLRGRGRSDENRRIARQITPGATEHDVFAALSLPFIPPELREGAGELEAALAGRVPRLLEPTDLLGEPGMRAPTRADAVAIGHALVRAGRRWVWWVRPLAMARSPRERRQLQRDAAFVATTTGLVVCPAIEVALGADGAFDDGGAYDDGFVVVVDATPIPGLARAAATARVLTAIESGRIHAVTRVQGRVLHADPVGADIDLSAVLRACARRRVVVEVSGEPERPDLSAPACRLATEVGALLALTARPARVLDVERGRWALWQARRGWVTPAAALSAMSFEQLASLWGPVAAAAPCATDTSHIVGCDDDESEDDDDAAVAPSSSAGLDAPHRRDELRRRLAVFLAGGEDLELERMLTRRGGHPLQVAFAMLSGLHEEGSD